MQLRRSPGSAICIVVVLAMSSSVVQGEPERQATASSAFRKELSLEPPAWPWVTTRQRVKLAMSQSSSVAVSSMPRLTAIGEKIRRVLVVELSSGGVCRSDDWYCPATLLPCGFLPFYILRCQSGSAGHASRPLTRSGKHAPRAGRGGTWPGQPTSDGRRGTDTLELAIPCPWFCANPSTSPVQPPPPPPPPPPA